MSYLKKSDYYKLSTNKKSEISTFFTNLHLLKIYSVDYFIFLWKQHFNSFRLFIIIYVS